MWVRRPGALTAVLSTGIAVFVSSTVWSEPATDALPHPNEAAAGKSAADDYSPSLDIASSGDDVAVAPTDSGTDKDATALPSQPAPEFTAPPVPDDASVVGRDRPFLVALHSEESWWEKNSISLIALALSLYSLWYTGNANTKSRKQSIEDDFWLRTVTYPLIVKPAAQFISELTTQLPKELNDGFPEKDAREFLEHFQRQIERHSDNLGLLPAATGLANAQATHAKMTQSLEKIEDVVTEYLYTNGVGVDPAKRVSRSDALAHIQEAFAMFLSPIRQLQEKS